MENAKQPCIFKNYKLMIKTLSNFTIKFQKRVPWVSQALFFLSSPQSPPEPLELWVFKKRVEVRPNGTMAEKEWRDETNGKLGRDETRPRKHAEGFRPSAGVPTSIFYLFTKSFTYKNK